MEERERFRRVVPVAALTVNVGRWTWGPEHPYPPWETLMNGAFWQEQRWSEVRASFSARRETPQILVSDAVDTREVAVPSPEPAEADKPPRSLLIYKSRDPVPAAAMGAAVALVVMECGPQSGPGWPFEQVFFSSLCHKNAQLRVFALKFSS